LTCSGGSCCPAPTILCGDKCLDPREDDANCGACGHECTGGEHCGAGTCRESSIKQVVLVVQENHTFDAYFGKYCKAAAFSNPTCTNGPGCCEGAPAKEASGATPKVLDDSFNFASDPNHGQACELAQIDGGKMDHYVTGSGVSGGGICGTTCSRPENFAVAPATTVQTYWDYATNNALADRYFQPIAGGTSSNDMFLAIAHYQFTDNQKFPNTIASGCTDPTELCVSPDKTEFVGRATIADLLMGAGKTFRVYADGYADAVAAGSSCPKAPSSCPYSSCILHPVACHACIYDPSDVPWQYYEQHADNTAYIKDYEQLFADAAAGKLPSFSYVKARAYRNEHPNVSKISDGIAFVDNTIKTILSSPQADSTLILLTWDEGGGFYDHVSPPPAIYHDDSGAPDPYGTRVPMLAIGPFAKKGTISHVVMEHSSVVRFLEWNFLGGVGQLGYNDAKVNNLGSLLDPAKTGVKVPEN
jgi:phospholipase C